MFDEKLQNRSGFDAKEYSTFRKLLFASDKRIPLSNNMDCIDKIAVDEGRQFVVK